VLLHQFGYGLNFTTQDPQSKTLAMASVDVLVAKSCNAFLYFDMYYCFGSCIAITIVAIVNQLNLS